MAACSGHKPSYVDALYEHHKTELFGKGRKRIPSVLSISEHDKDTSTLLENIAHLRDLGKITDEEHTKLSDLALIGGDFDGVKRAVEGSTRAGTEYYIRKLLLQRGKEVTEKRNVILGAVSYGNHYHMTSPDDLVDSSGLVILDSVNHREATARELFLKYDHNCSGRVEESELASLLRDLGLSEVRPACLLPWGRAVKV